jgi:drug/metabolite transporter (DMT)-like permease
MREKLTLKIASIKSRIVSFTDKYKTGILWIVTTLALIFANAGFAGNGIAFTLAKRFNINPYVISSFRIYGSIPILFVLVLIFEGVQRHTLREVPFMCFTAIFGVFAAQLTFSLANYYVGPSYCALFQPMPIIITSLVGIVLKTENISIRKFWGWAKIVGIALAAIGSTAMVLVNAITSLKNDDWKDIVIGNILMVGNILFWSSYLMILKRFYLNPVQKVVPPLATSVDVAPNEQATIEMIPETNDNMDQTESYKQLPEMTPIAPIHEMSTINVEIASPNTISDSESHLPDVITSEHEPEVVIKMDHHELKSKLKLDLTNLDPKERASMEQQFAPAIDPIQPAVEIIFKKPYGPVNLTFWMFCYAALGYIVVDIYLLFTDINVFRVGTEFIWPTIYVASVGSAIPLCMVIYATKVTSPLFVSAFSILQLPYTVILAWLFFQQQLAIQDYIGGALIVMGLICVIVGGFTEKREMDAKKRMEKAPEKAAEVEMETEKLDNAKNTIN